MPSTPRRGWNIPSRTGDDPNDWYDAWVDLQADTDADMPYSEGTWASKPDPALRGQVYRATDRVGLFGGAALYIYHGIGSGDARWQPLGTSLGPTILPTFSAVPASSGATISTTMAKVALATEEWDDAGAYDPANSRLTPTTPGVYRLSAVMMTVEPGAGVLQLAVAKNGAVHRYIDPRDSGVNTSAVSAAGSVLVQANGTSDYFELWASMSAGGYTVSKTADSMIATQFQGELVRPN